MNKTTSIPCPFCRQPAKLVKRGKRVVAINCYAVNCPAVQAVRAKRRTA